MIRILGDVRVPESEILPIRILLASHQPIVRNGLRALLEREAGFRVVAEAANGREAIVLADYKRPDVALLDMKLPLVNGIAVARQISASGHSPAAVFVSAYTEQSYVHEAFRAGAKGYVDGDCAPSDLSRAVRAVARGRLFLSPAICSQLLEPDVTKGSLSEQERAVWCFIAAGYEEAEIAELLNIDSKRVRLDSHSLKSLFCRSSLPEAIAQCILAAHRAFSQSWLA